MRLLTSVKQCIMGGCGEGRQIEASCIIRGGVGAGHPSPYPWLPHMFVCLHDPCMYIDQIWDMKWSLRKDHLVKYIMIIIQWTGNKLVIRLTQDNLYLCSFLRETTMVPQWSHTNEEQSDFFSFFNTLPLNSYIALEPCYTVFWYNQQPTCSHSIHTSELKINSYKCISLFISEINFTENGTVSHDLSMLLILAGIKLVGVHPTWWVCTVPFISLHHLTSGAFSW